MKKLNELAEWKALQDHHKQIASQSMSAWFGEDPLRFEHFSLQIGGILYDYSKNRVTAETVKLLCKLAKAADLQTKINGLFEGQPFNTSERRPALHTLLRQMSDEPFHLNGKNIMPEILAAREQMRHFVEQVHNQTWRGATGKPIRDIVNIGIGGSHLGPFMATHALSDFHVGELRCHYISNVDSAHLQSLFKQIDPESALFIVSSKSFTTIETLTNAKTIRALLQDRLGKTDVSSHFVAVTTAADKAQAFGIPAAQIFPLWDWVGGRYSVWSTIGLPLALMIGMDQFEQFLAGAHEVDNHFKNTEFEKNIPVMMALLGIWYINFFHAHHQAVIPYAHSLNYFHPYLQQLDMESNGKRVTHQGIQPDYLTGPIIFGEQGSNAQHAFHQLLHQGPDFVPVDFILVGKNKNALNDHQDILVASGLSQAKALLHGNSFEQAVADLRANGYSDSDASWLATHKHIPGNRPSTTFFLNEMSPRNLGALLALYEHKIFVQGAIWNINSFDQWGVELGKQLLPQILQDLTTQTTVQHDASTQGLIEFYKNCRKNHD